MPDDADRHRVTAGNIGLRSERPIRVGVTEWHGMLQEQAENPPPGVEYIEATRRRSILNRLVSSPIKGFFPVIDDSALDVLESIISPSWCRVPWICSVANYQEVLAFSLLGMPTPRAVRQAIVRPLFRSERFLAFTFWSRAGLQTMTEYGRVTDPILLGKATVVYPAVKRRADRLDSQGGRDLLLFGGDFFRKGGVHAVESFERLQDRYPGLQLRLCCDPALDFRTYDDDLRSEFLARIHANPRIVMGRVSRNEMVEGLLPRSVAYLLPSYDETFGFAVLEAMSAGVPVVATREFAIPEMLDHGTNGWLLEYHESEKRVLMSGYLLRTLPQSIRSRISDELTFRLDGLLQDTATAVGFGLAGQRAARERFSIEARNASMRAIYARARVLADARGS
jgi:glycosyltransferase involved in cell wall biosynthesis